MRYLASVVFNCFNAFGELLSLPKRFAEISGGVRRLADMSNMLDSSYHATIRMAEGHEAADGLLAFRHATVSTPPNHSMEPFAVQLSMEVQQG